VRTRVGYAGGSKPHPTYHNLGDHTESIQIDYDPERISYQDLLDVFWDSHLPTSRPWSRQYASIIFYHNAEQERLALESKRRAEAKWGKTMHTEIVPFERFYLAEGYHQKYYLRSARDLMQEFSALYPDEEEFVHSTVVARVNGYLGGHGTPAAMQEILDSVPLSPAAKQRLLQTVARIRC